MPNNLIFNLKINLMLKQLNKLLYFIMVYVIYDLISFNILILNLLKIFIIYFSLSIYLYIVNLIY